MGQPKDISDDGARLRELVGVPDGVRVEGEQIDDVVGFVLGEQVGVDLREVCRQDDVGVLALERGEADVGVLDVDTGGSRWFSVLFLFE